MTFKGISDEAIDRLIVQERRSAHYFYYQAPIRFSDMISKNDIHFSKVLEFMEMARFAILEQYQYFLEERMAVRERNISKEIKFVLIKADYEAFEQIKKNGMIKIRSRLILEKLPYMTFKQEIMSSGWEKVYGQGTIKNVLLNEQMKMTWKWDPCVLCTMLDFIHSKGERP